MRWRFFFNDDGESRGSSRAYAVLAVFSARDKHTRMCTCGYVCVEGVAVSRIPEVKPPARQLCRLVSHRLPSLGTQFIESAEGEERLVRAPRRALRDLHFFLPFQPQPPTYTYTPLTHLSITQKEPLHLVFQSAISILSRNSIYIYALGAKICI